jgi:hypothetical protein
MSCIHVSYELYLYLLHKEIDKLVAQGHDLYTAYRMARQNIHYSYSPPTPCAAPSRFPEPPRLVLVDNE